jgi:biopolymer transport protein TolR
MIDLPSVGKAAKQPDKVVQMVIGKDESLASRSRDKWPGPARWPWPPSSSAAGNEPGSSAVVISADRSVKYEAGGQGHG